MPPDFEPVLVRVLSEYLNAPASRGSWQVGLTWNAPPQDLDLHAWIEAKGERHHIYYKEKGALDTEPFVALDFDRRSGGVETLTIANTQFDRVTIAVHNFSGG